MKKVLCIVLSLFFLFTSSSLGEEIDLSGLSLRELEALRNRCLLEMMKRDDWQEVTVPQGVYQVGVQIPAGTWTIQCTTGSVSIITWGEKLERNGQDIEFNGRYDYEAVYNPEHPYYEAGERTTYTFTVRNGDWIVIDEGPALFTPGSITPSFAFK